MCRVWLSSAQACLKITFMVLNILSSSKVFFFFRDWTSTKRIHSERGCKQLTTCLFGVVTAYSLSSRTVTHLARYPIGWMTTDRWSPITRYIVFYPDLLAVGGFMCDMCAHIVRQDYTRAHQAATIFSASWQLEARNKNFLWKVNSFSKANWVFLMVIV